MASSILLSRIVLLVAITLTLASLTVWGKHLAPMKRTKMDRVVRQIMRCAKIPALALTIYKQEDSSLYVKAYGLTNRNARKRADMNTRFCLGGATEAFTAVLLAKLIDENENVTWSTPIQEITGKAVTLPGSYRSDNINLKDILAQRSGLPGMDIVPITSPFSSRRLISNLRYVTPAAGFREKFIPNQVLYSLLGDVFQVLGGDSWEKLLIKHILQPLDLNTVMYVGGEDVYNAANVAFPSMTFNGRSTTIAADTLKGLKLIDSAATLCLSANDLSKWLRFVMTGKGENGEQIIDQEVLRQTFMGVQVRDYSNDPEIVGYKQPAFAVSYSREQNALGWITGHYRGDHFVSQDGSIPGYQSLATILPSRNVGVFTAFTGDGGEMGLAAKVLLNMFGLDIIMGNNNHWFNDSQVCDLMNRMKKLHPKESMETPSVVRVSSYEGVRQLNDYVNHYRNYAYGDVMIKFNETADPDLIMEYGQATYKMIPTNINDTFQLLAEGAMWFTTNADSNRDNPLIAVFNEFQQDPEDRVSSLTISGFDRNGDVTFSINPEKPRFGESKSSDADQSKSGDNDQSKSDPQTEVHCGTSMNSATSVILLLVMSAAILFR